MGEFTIIQINSMYALCICLGQEAKIVCVVGDFNSGDTSANPMTKTINGDCTARLDLETGKEYQFRYLVDGSKWENDWDADRYVKSCYGDCDNSVIVT